ncbi:hypothetical protein GJV26_20320 [Massilia dura]|uniref:Double-GTPase 1 domain-containing protein n=1 Tax=Pseudoduganella dura TaxID=321982 RepID=A0A6I3XJR5_9BURK|nr:hypothetical protein [Pseudoduganella dura]MUI14790.1 hypothetical protein [Pseudoduganella dura]GGX98015.1 hypothetical protein GCM10007386_31100 [Pseudoduganella dura]
MAEQHTILLVGESGVGKTHYGAQFLKRLSVETCALKAANAPSNVTPFATALSCLTEGLATHHTPADSYVESVWPIRDETGRVAELVWPDYGGEQVRNLAVQRQIPEAWRERVLSATDWVLLIRPHSIRKEDDLFSRPLQKLGKVEPQPTAAVHSISDQARMLELLQILLYLGQFHLDKPLRRPGLTILLTCWDEVNDPRVPADVIADQLPMLWSFVHSNWATPTVMGLSALGRALSTEDADVEFASVGPEDFGYVILPDGQQSSDITLPIQRLMSGRS